VQSEPRSERDPSASAAVPPSCTLDRGGLEGQRERYRRAGAAVVAISRERHALIVDFAPELDREALRELMAVERECCPFFRFRFDDRRRRLQVGVERAEQAAALEAIETAFSPSR
jgi:hypothetical protein